MTHDHVGKWACPRSAGARLSTRETGNEANIVLYIPHSLEKDHHDEQGGHHVVLVVQPTQTSM